MFEGGSAALPRGERVIDVAGSREAIAALLASLPCAPGVAVLVLTDGPPAFDASDLAAWFAAHTPLPVSAARDGAPLAVNHVYVLPPGAAARVESGVLHLATGDGDVSFRTYRAKLEELATEAALAEERERRRIAADLHDRVGQSLAFAQIALASAREGTREELACAAASALTALAQSSADIRTLIFDLSPPILYDLGLPAALEWLAEQTQERHGLAVDLEVDASACPPPREDVTALLFRFARELLVNVVKHARASRARLSVTQGEGAVVVEVADEGAGFDPNELSDSSRARTFGLFNVRDQVTRLGGALAIDSGPGHGTRVRVSVPRVR